MNTNFVNSGSAGLATVNMSLMLVFVLSTAILSCSLAALRTLSRSGRAGERSVIPSLYDIRLTPPKVVSEE